MVKPTVCSYSECSRTEHPGYTPFYDSAHISQVCSCYTRIMRIVRITAALNSVRVYFGHYSIIIVLYTCHHASMVQKTIALKITKPNPSMEQFYATVSLDVYKSASHQVFTRVHSWQTCQTRRPAEQACAVCGAIRARGAEEPSQCFQQDIVPNLS